MTLIRHTMDKTTRNDNYAMKQESQRTKLDFCGVYPANNDRPAMANIDIVLTDYYEKTSRTMYGDMTMTKEETIALRDKLNDIIASDRWDMGRG